MRKQKVRMMILPSWAMILQPFGLQLQTSCSKTIVVIEHALSPTGTEYHSHTHLGCNILALQAVAANIVPKIIEAIIYVLSPRRTNVIA